jgi:large subunit ribosomal protein L9
MKVILLQDVKSLGKKDEIVEINEGYARNFILKKNLGLEATGKNLNDIKLKKANEEKVAEEKYAEAKDYAKVVESKKVIVKIKAGKDGKTFGSVSSKEIATEAMTQHGLDIDKKKIVLPEPLKSIGVFKVTVKLHPKVTAELTVEVQEE